jgi:CubicO group peptidase (beta-lactamase class C family)
MGRESRVEGRGTRDKGRASLSSRAMRGIPWRRRNFLAVLGMTSALGMTPGIPAAAGAQTDARIDSIFAEWQGTDRPGCAVGVRRASRAVHLAAYGMANLEYGVPLTAGSVLESGSVAKQFTAAALVLLAQRGRLTLDDDIRRYLPEVPDFGWTITIRHLLTHTSGLRDQWGLLSLRGSPPGSQVHTMPLILDLVSRQRMLNFPTGEEYLYSNTGYALAAMIVERASGRSLARFSAEEFFTPLGMSRTQWRDDYRRIVPDRATAYSREGGQFVQNMPFTMVYGNGGLLTTVGDLLIWNDALTDGTVPGGAELVRELETVGRLRDGSAIGYALGLGIGSYRGVRQVGHSGSTAGYSTYLVRYPDERLSIAVLCNVAGAGATQYARRIADLFLPEGPASGPPSPVAVVEPALLASLAGTYHDTTSDRFVTFRVRDGGLVTGGSGPGTPLTALEGMRFWSSAGGSYAFEREGDGWRVRQWADGWRTYLPARGVDTARLRLTEYTGWYRSDELDVLYEATVEEGSVMLRSRPGGPIELTPIYPDGFRAGGRTVRFMRDPGGAVIGFRIFADRVRDVRFRRVAGGQS